MPVVSYERKVRDTKEILFPRRTHKNFKTCLTSQETCSFMCSIGHNFIATGPLLCVVCRKCKKWKHHKKVTSVRAFVYLSVCMHIYFISENNGHISITFDPTKIAEQFNSGSPQSVQSYFWIESNQKLIASSKLFIIQKFRKLYIDISLESINPVSIFYW